MNKILKIIIAIAGAFEVIFDIISPILLIILWQTYFPSDSIGAYILYSIGFITTIFRSSKFIINMNNE